jgi:hypothetical protein
MKLLVNCRQHVSTAYDRPAFPGRSSCQSGWRRGPSFVQIENILFQVLAILNDLSLIALDIKIARWFPLLRQ